MGSIIQWLDANLPDDAVFTNGAGNYATWVHRFHRYRRHSGQLAPTSGSMGYGAPAAVAAKIINPERTVRSEEHTSELQSLMRHSYAVFCLKKKKYKHYTESQK